MGKKWYKGNLHSHTINSDGYLTPDEAVKLYKDNGYDFICFSEHDHYTDLSNQYNTDNFIILPGLEASAYLVSLSESDKNKLGIIRQDGEYITTTFNELWSIMKRCGGASLIKTHHIHGILGNLEMQKKAGNRGFMEEEYTPIRIYLNQWNGVKAAQDLSDYLKLRGCFTTYNHPIWSRVEIEDVRGVNGIWAIECYNYNTVNECGEGEDTVFWDDLLRHNCKINAFASDDNHNNGKFPDSCGGYVMVRATGLTHEEIVNALLSGEYYSSNGAVIGDICYDNNHIKVSGIEAKKIDIIVGGPVGSSKTILAKDFTPITEIDFEIPGNASYARIEIEDYNGKKAWTNAYASETTN